MDGKRVGILVVVVSGLISFGTLIACFLAGADIWHELGSPNFWRGEGFAALEWRVLGIGWWIIAAFHIAFFVTATVVMARWKK